MVTATNSLSAVSVFEYCRVENWEKTTFSVLNAQCIMWWMVGGFTLFKLEKVNVRLICFFLFLVVALELILRQNNRQTRRSFRFVQIESWTYVCVCVPYVNIGKCAVTKISDFVLISKFSHRFWFYLSAILVQPTAAPEFYSIRWLCVGCSSTSTYEKRGGCPGSESSRHFFLRLPTN